MGPVFPLSLREAAASVAFGPHQTADRRRTVRLRVSWTAAHAARQHGIQMGAAALLRWLTRSDVQDQLQLGSAASVATAVEYLAWLLQGDEVQRSRDAETVLFLVLTALLRAQDPAAATILAYQWQVEHTRAEGGATRQAIHGARDSILGRLSA